MKKGWSKLAALGILSLGLIGLTGCEDLDKGGTSTQKVIDGVLEEAQEVEKEEGAVKEIKEVKPRDYTMNELASTIEVNGKQAKLLTQTYIEKRFASDWYYTADSNVNLSIKVLEENPDLTIRVTGVYSDISIVSNNKRTNGLRQDSLHMDYSSSQDKGYDIDTKNDFTVPFQIEGIDKNQESVSIYNGYGYYESSRLVESDFRKYAIGANLSVVWYLAVTDNEANKTYMKPINTNVLLPVKGDN